MKVGKPATWLLRVYISTYIWFDYYEILYFLLFLFVSDKTINLELVLS